MSTQNSRFPDVLIIGGGVIGCSIAYHLTKRGCRNVVVVERNTIGSGSTAKAAGGFRQQFSYETNVRLAMYSINFFEHFHEQLELPPDAEGVDFHQIGYLFLLSTPEAFTTFERSAALQQRLGLPVEVLTPEQVGSRWPWLSVHDLVGATYCPTDGYGRPHNVMQAFATQAQRLGASFVEGAEVSAITRKAARIMTVETNQGSFSPGSVIICAGPWSGELGRLAGVEIPVQPLRRMCFVTDPFDAIPQDAPMTIEMPNTFHFRPEGAGFMLGTSDQDEPYGFHTTMRWEWLERVMEDAAKRVPVLEQAKIHHGWAGLYETSPDHNAILGPIPGVENLLVATGFSGHGVMQSPATGMIMSEFILDGKAHTLDVSDLGIERFSTGRLHPENHVI
ncbi:MAG: FAD-binding oxidoreductase [Chloroflexi bacterium]|nr:MAG: FAD-binding oxidoreductase [Chloroflexota bacterium]